MTTLSAPADAPPTTSPIDRYAPLLGPATLVLGAVMGAVAGTAPGPHDSGATVLRIVAGNENGLKYGSLLEAFTVVGLLATAAIVCQHLRRHGGGTPALVAFGGAVVLAVGGAFRAGVGWILATSHEALAPAAAQALNTLYYGHYPAITGIAILNLGLWLAILRTRALPLWLGWLALPIAIAAVAPPSLPPLLATVLWLAVAGVVLTLRHGDSAPGRA